MTPDAVRHMVQGECVALCAVLPLGAFSACGINQVRLERGRVFDPPVHRAWGDLSLNLVSTNTDEPIVLLRGLRRKPGWKFRLQGDDAANVPMHLRLVQY